MPQDLPAGLPLLSENELVALLQSGSRESFNYLYDHYSVALYGIIIKVVADEGIAQDVLQETFVKIWKNIGAYDAEKGRIFTWMLNIARNAAIDKIRSRGEVMRQKIHSSESAVNNLVGNSANSPRPETIGMDKLISALKPDQAAVIEMAYYRGYTLEEISKDQGIPLGTVKTRMRAGIQKLRTFFNK